MKINTLATYSLYLFVFCLFAVFSFPADLYCAELFQGFPKKFASSAGLNSPAVGDVDGDKSPDIVLTVGAEIHVLTAEGEPSYAVPVKGGSITASPTLHDLDGDGALEIVIGDLTGKLHVISGGTTEEKGFPKQLKGGITSTALVADIDLDGRPEIAVGTKAGLLYVLKSNGSILHGFPKKLGSAIKGNLALGDLTGDGRPELVAATQSGSVFVITSKGRILKGWPKKARFEVSGGVSLGDVDDDGMFEVVFGSQDFKLYAFNGDGTSVKGFPLKTPYRIYGAPALADLDGDDVTDIVVAIGDGKVWAINGSGQMLRGWPRRVGKRISGGPVVADVDRDGDLEVVVASGDAGLAVFHHNGKLMAGFPVELGGATYATPTVADLDRDGAMDILVGTVEKELYCFRVPPEDKEGVAPPSWPTMGRDFSRVGHTYPNRPRFKNLKILPEKPGTRDTLKADYEYFDLDGEPERDTQVRWYLAGKEVKELNGSKEVSPEMTKKGQHWRVEIQGGDNFKRFGRSGKGAKVYRSRVVIIRNSPPGAPEISIAPNNPKTGDDLLVKILKDAPDPDGEKVSYTFRWIRNHKPVKISLHSMKISSRRTRKGDHWIVVVTASDGKEEGNPARAETKIENTPPGPAEFELVPKKPKTTDEIKVRIKRHAKDPDGDKVHYDVTWKIDGKQVPSPPDKLVLAPHFAVKGQEVTARLTSLDDKERGAVAEAKTALFNSRPRPPRVIIKPDKPDTENPLSVFLADEGEDDDQDTLSYHYRWFRDGKVIKGFSASTVPPSMTKRGQVWKVEVKSDDGFLKSKPSFAEVKVGNAPPVPPGISWKSGGTKTTEPLEVIIDKPATDPDGDKVRLNFLWSRDGKTEKGAVGPVLSPGMTKKGDCWSVEVTPYDGKDKGKPVRMTRCIENTPPGPPGIELEPKNPFTTDDLVCKVAHGSKDPDNDKITYSFQWFRNNDVFRVPKSSRAMGKKGKKQSGSNNKTSAVLSSSYTTKGDEWTCKVIPNDGQANGTPFEAKVKIANRAPTAPIVTIEPRNPKTGDRLVAHIEKPSSDSDGDGISYEYHWFKSGNEQKDLKGRADVPPGRVVKGAMWSLEVIPNDGLAYGKPGKASVQIGNTSPSPPVIAITPQHPRTKDDIRVVIRKKAVDPDKDKLTFVYRWYLNGKLVPAKEGLDATLLPSGETSSGQNWRVEAMAKDDSSSSKPGFVEFTIGNTPPAKPSIEIVPKHPKTNDNIQCKVLSQPQDPDGDKVSYRYSWLKDSKPIGRSGKKPFIDARLTAKGQVWTCEVAPFDGSAVGPRARKSVEITNSAPTPPAIVVQPQAPTRLDRLTCKNVKKAVDPDKDNLEVKYYWLRNGKKVDFAPDAAILPAGSQKEGEKWSCMVEVTDGESVAKAQSKVVVIGNAPPSAPSVIVEPSRPETGDDLHCWVSSPAIDPDMDPVAYRYKWYLGNKHVKKLDGKDLVQSGMTRKRQKWTCMIKAVDDQGASGPDGSSSVQVVNAPPGKAKVMVQPESPTSRQDLHCKVVEPSLDPDGDKVSYDYYWYKDDILQKSLKGRARVPSRLTKSADIWRCEAVPKAAGLEGPRAVSSDVIVR
ncbi:MAG: VCBS repeat-containing protein [Deltaproteobacteria bacterium]|nr:VCBS repeat-containing protein [Deltaproteobacteria bacterium]